MGKANFMKCSLGVQDLKGKILVKGKKEKVEDECPSSSSDFSSDDEVSRTEGKANKKEEEKKVGKSKSNSVDEC